MLTSILSTTFRTARMRWKSLLVVALAAGVASTVVLYFVNTIALVDESLSAGGAIFLSLLLGLIACWGTLAGVRIPLRNDLAGEALSGAIPDAPKLFAASIVLTVLVLPWLFVFPMIILIGAIAAGGHGLGFGPALRYGIAQCWRNLGAYVALILFTIVVLVIDAICMLIGAALVVGVPSGDDFATLDAVGELVLDARYGLLVGWLLASCANGVLFPSFVAATWKAFDSRAAADEWKGEDLEAAEVTQEISPAVAALLGETAGPRRRRMHVPPRAAQPGRLPGPGVNNVVDVALPAGATGRPVEAPTLELDAFDSGAGGTGVVTPVAPAMWVSSQALGAAAAAWKRLAAGFEESGLWPLLLPEVEFGLSEPWTEQRARRERDSLDADAVELFRARLEGSLKSTPLTSTEAFSVCGVTRGELTRGSGKRTDALDFAFAELGDSRLALVAVTRPADAVHRVAWPGTYVAGITGAELAEMLVSWEERWGALLVGMTHDSLVLAVLRPPATLGEAVEAAAEHHATCPDEADEWGDDRTYAETLINAPVWRLTWT